VRRLTAAALTSLLLAGCSAARSTESSTEILVFAAASLTESFRAIGEAFHQAYPAISVRFNLGPSDGLATQIGEGGPADVFASASPKWMDAVSKGTGVNDRATFARNELVVLVPASNPAKIERFSDVANPGVKLVLAAATVPVGAYARQALADAGLLRAATRNVVSNEEDVKGVVGKITLGEADAGIAYATDLTQAIRDRVTAVEIPEEWNVVAAYPIAVVASSRHAAQARTFVRYVLGPGRLILERFGFLSP
jgi:molybdate transport system substrate-binding protein